MRRRYHAGAKHCPMMEIRMQTEKTVSMGRESSVLIARVTVIRPVNAGNQQGKTPK